MNFLKSKILGWVTRAAPLITVAMMCSGKASAATVASHIRHHHGHHHHYSHHRSRFHRHHHHGDHHHHFHHHDYGPGRTLASRGGSPTFLNSAAIKTAPPALLPTMSLAPYPVDLLLRQVAARQPVQISALSFVPDSNISPPLDMPAPYMSATTYPGIITAPDASAAQP